MIKAMTICDNGGVILVKQEPGQIYHWSGWFWSLWAGPHLPIPLRHISAATLQPQTSGMDQQYGKSGNFPGILG